MRISDWSSDLCSSDLIAIDAESGRSLWRYDARPDATGVPVATCCGVAYYKVPDAAGLCAERIITATIDARLLALDAITGRPCPGFGHNGAVDLRVDMGRVDQIGRASCRERVWQ